jgi:NAD(P)-dependent dehydrogenase (short-subunit alcohol dehydrogenase family)
MTVSGEAEITAASGRPVPVWLITGCSSGFGLAIARAVLARGWRAVITARDVGALAPFAQAQHDRALVLPLDVTDRAQIASVVAQAGDRFGRIDVLVNNAGYGYHASVEEGDEAEIRALFEVNVFGLMAVTRAVLPMMRAQRFGHVLNISSVAGFVGYPASGFYAASKHAVEGLSDSLAREVAPLGIRVCTVAPGPFRTDFVGRSMHRTTSTIPDYADTVAARMAAAVAGNGAQPGDPDRAADAMIRITEAPDPPRHLVLGAMGVGAVPARLNAILDDITRWRDLALWTDRTG